MRKYNFTNIIAFELYIYKRLYLLCLLSKTLFVFHLLHCLFIRKSWRHFLPILELTSPHLNIFCMLRFRRVCIQSLKEYFQALEMDKMHIFMWYLHIRRQFNDVIFLFWFEDTMGDMLILIIYPLDKIFGAFRLKLAHKMQESPDPHILQWTNRLNCTDTIYAKMMTS